MSTAGSDPLPEPRGIVGELRRTLAGTVGPLVDRVCREGGRFALVGVPSHGNVGDSAIFLGELGLLRALGLGRPAYTCDVHTYDPDAMRRAIGDGPVLLHGGGNLGDLWTEPHELRVAVLADFPRNPVLQLPQSLCFRSERTLEEARRALDRHPALTLLVRDRASLEVARRHFRAPSDLCPDGAFWLGRLARPVPRVDVLRLLRTDLEAPPELPPARAASEGTDWVWDPPHPLLSVDGWLRRLHARHHEARPFAARLIQGVAPALARARLRRGLELLGSARVVVTNRLHGHVLCLLLGIPHVVLPDAHDKLLAFRETWTRDACAVLEADDLEEAERAARELLIARGRAEEVPSP